MSYTGNELRYRGPDVDNQIAQMKQRAMEDRLERDRKLRLLAEEARRLQAELAALLEYARTNIPAPKEAQ